MLNVVLVQPEIPANTGNIGRTCVLAGARLHLVGPLGFSLDERAVRRAGLLYWQSLDVTTYRDWNDFLERNPSAQVALGARAGDASVVSETTPPAEAVPAMHLLTKAGQRIYSDATYHDGDWLVFGKESAGLDRELLLAHPDLCERIPMRGDDALTGADAWHASHERLHPEAERDICGNFVDSREGVVASLNLSNSVAIVLFEALRQLGWPGLG